MISARRLAANRRNAQFSTGPRTPAGKARAAQNARRHGFRMALPADCDGSPEVAALARRIAGEGAGAHAWALACRIAQAQVDLMQIRRARMMLLARYCFADGACGGGDGSAEADAIRRLPALDRYERYALTRRRRAIRAFDELARTKPTPEREKSARTKPTRSTLPSRPRDTVADFARTNPSVAPHASNREVVMAGLVPAISLGDASCPPERDARHKAGHDGGKAGASTWKPP